MDEITSEHSMLIELISKHCESQYGELLIECMEFCGVSNTMSLTVEGMREFCKLKGIKEEAK